MSGMPLAAVPELVAEVLGEVEEMKVVTYDPLDLETVPGGGREVDVLATSFNAGRWLRQLDRVPGLKAVVLASAGYEHALPHLPAGVQLANAVGVHDTATAELALTLMLAAQRSLPTWVRTQERQVWGEEGWTQRSLADSTVLVLGYGGIGRALTRRLLAAECGVIAVASTDKPGDELVEQVHGIDRLPELLPHADVLAVCVPMSEQNRHLVDAEVLTALPDDALVVNIARGGVVDQEALLAECASGRLRAALDVTDPEPLPADHPLWSTPGVLITPHVGGASPASFPRWGRYLRSQLTAYRDTGALEHRVDPGA
ncbi:NAD(P)-dependent oxidoreductase [Ornithinimicrobium panacihumi]|uniref:NAD(P)-dependent oxidoreductase n=1 Tax=Ornithinimicrobium panacihumi TaxID=2008449 RepID=UPI003F897728